MKTPASIALVLGWSAMLLTAGCERHEQPQRVVAGGDPDQGAVIIRTAECGSCHTIPGVDDAAGTMGPPLYFWSKRSFIAGNVPNSPHLLVQWLLEPRSIEPGTAMPDVGLTEQQARDVAAYLYTLE